MMAYFIFLTSFGCKEYTLIEKINLWRGKIYSGDSTLKDEILVNDLSEIVTKLDLPVYFMSGVYDYTVNYTMTKDYFEQLNAPVKGFYLFLNSAHSPMFEEPEKFLNIIQKDILTGKTELADID
ncbi:MAG: alpha/beta hydrolase [Ruminiclostridium sp.]|nr:alpha/beta hydrolase [Ruminiclostridium sp.]